MRNENERGSKWPLVKGKYAIKNESVGGSKGNAKKEHIYDA